MKKMGMLFPTIKLAMGHKREDSTYQDPSYLHRYRIERRNLEDHGPKYQYRASPNFP
jgi:hypothetical protein